MRLRSVMCIIRGVVARLSLIIWNGALTIAIATERVTALLLLLLWRRRRGVMETGLCEIRVGVGWMVNRGWRSRRRAQKARVIVSFGVEYMLGLLRSIRIGILRVCGRVLLMGRGRMV